MQQKYMTFPVYSQITVPTLVWLIFERTWRHTYCTTPGCYRPTFRLSVPKTEAACCRQSLIVYCGLYAVGHCMFQLLNPSYNDYACPPSSSSPPPHNTNKSVLRPHLRFFSPFNARVQNITSWNILCIIHLFMP